MVTKKQLIDFRIRWSWHSLSRAYNCHAKKFNSSNSIGYALLNIDKNGTFSTELGPKMGMEPTSLSRLLNTMEDRKLIFRTQNPRDGRSILIHLTSFGVEKREDSKSVVLNFNSEIEKKLSETKIQHFFEVMESIREIAKEFEYFSGKTIKTI